MKVLLDTNFLMDCFRYRVDMAELFDLLPDSRLATVPQVVEEIKRIAAGKSMHARYAKVAARLMDGIEIVDAPRGNADDALVALASRENVVATNDGRLRERIRRKGLKTIYLRGRKHLAVS